MIGGDGRHLLRDQCLVHYLAQLPHLGAEEAEMKNDDLEDVDTLKADPRHLQDGDIAGIGERTQAVVMIVQDPKHVQTPLAHVRLEDNGPAVAVLLSRAVPLRLRGQDLIINAGIRRHHRAQGLVHVH